MSFTVPGRWIAAARWSGRLDLRPVLERPKGLDILLNAPPSSLLEMGLSGALIRDLCETPDQSSDHIWIPMGDPRYPPALLELERPPPVLWVQGELGRLSGWGLGVVGTRRCTTYGKKIAWQIGQAVSGVGGCVISGAAQGIDEAAHRAALGSGATVAVLGAGLDADETPRARSLHGAILDAGGLLLSEMPPTDPPARWTFPRRNRLIAALSRAVVVVEAPLQSGALHTARSAAELGRPLFAVPGPMGALASEGTLELIAQGAICLRSVGELLESAPPGGSDPASRLKRALSSPALPAELARRAALALPEVTQALTLLELTGVVRRLPDHRYALR